MIPLRICLAAAGAVLALGGGTALAAPALMGSVSHGDRDTATTRTMSAATQHGTAHSSSASGHSDAVSDRASKPSTSSNDAHGDAVSAAAKSCAHGTASDRDAHGDCVSAVAKGSTSPKNGH